MWLRATRRKKVKITTPWNGDRLESSKSLSIYYTVIQYLLHAIFIFKTHLGQLRKIMYTSFLCSFHEPKKIDLLIYNNSVKFFIKINNAKIIIVFLLFCNLVFRVVFLEIKSNFFDSRIDH